MKKQPTAREINAHLASIRPSCDVYNPDGALAMRISRARTSFGVLQGRSFWTGEWTAIAPSQYVALTEPLPVAASVTVDLRDVMEQTLSWDHFVAQAWLDQHAERIEEAMEKAWKAYVAENWKGNVE